MPLYISVAMIREGNTIKNHVFTTVAPDEQEAIERSKIDLGASHPPAPDKAIMGASIFTIDPEAIREAYAELSPQSQETIQ